MGVYMKKIEISVKYMVESHQDAYIKILDFIYDKYPNALKSFEQLPKHGEKGKRYLARSKEKLYVNNPILANRGRHFRNGWFIPGNIGPKTLNRIVQMFLTIVEIEYEDKLEISCRE